MAYFALMYELVDDYLTRRSQFREQHLKMANDLKARGEIVLAGAFADPPDKALLVFDADDRSVPENFAKHDQQGGKHGNLIAGPSSRYPHGTTK